MCNSRTAAQKSGGGGLPLGGFHFKVLALHSVVALRDPETVVHFFVESVCHKANRLCCLKGSKSGLVANVVQTSDVGGATGEMERNVW